MSANSYLDDVSTPIQLHHAAADETVPVVLSQDLRDDLDELGKVNEYYEYQGDNHNISNNFSSAMNKSVDFFDKYFDES